MQFLGARSVAECVGLVEERLLQSRLLGVFVGWQETPLGECASAWMIPSAQRLLLEETTGKLRSCPVLAWLAPADIQSRRIRVEPPVAVGRWRRYPQSISADAEKATAVDPLPRDSTALVYGVDRSLFSNLSNWSPSASLLALQSMPRLGSRADDALTLCAVPQVAVDAIRLPFQPLTGYHRILATAGNLISRLEDCDQLGTQISGSSDDSNVPLYLETEDGSVAQVIAGNPAKGMLALDSQSDLTLHVGQRIRLGRAQPLRAAEGKLPGPANLFSPANLPGPVNLLSPATLTLVGAPTAALSAEPLAAPTWSSAARINLPHLQSLYLRARGQHSLGIMGGATVTSTIHPAEQ